jgi:hypothetical protein
MKVSALFLSLFFVTTSFAQSTLSGAASKTSWGGHWWTMRDGELALGWKDGDSRKSFTPTQAAQFDQCITTVSDACKKLIQSHLNNKGLSLSPMMKFDLWVKKQVDSVYAEGSAVSMYSRATANELKIHYITGPSHRHAEASGYAGKCTGWSLSNMDFSEPTIQKTIDGITFMPADIKGILAAIYNGAQFFVPDEMVLGNAYRSEGEGRNQNYYNDPAPKELILALEKHIKKEKKIIVADMDPSDGVWNHPLYAYEVKLAAPIGNQVKGQMTLHYANDEVDFDEVFSTNVKRPDLIQRTLQFELTVPSNWNGSINTATSSAWLADSKNKHPDSLIFGLENNWRKSIYEYKTTSMNLEVNYQLIKKVNLGRGYQVMVDELLRKYYQ